MLYLAPVDAGGDLADVAPVPIPADASLAAGASVVMRDACAYWSGQGGGLWRLDCASGEALQVAELPGARHCVSVEKDGPRAVWEAQERLNQTLAPLRPGAAPRTAPAGQPPLRHVMAWRDYLLIVSDRLNLYVGGVEQGSIPSPAGQWIDGVLIPDGRAEPRLLALTREDGFAILTAVALASGADSCLWREAGREPLVLLPVAGSLFVVHREGLVRLSEVAV